MDTDSSSDEELELMAVLVAAIAKKRKSRGKRKVWVKELYRSREVEGINNLVSVMKVSNRDSYFKYKFFYGSNIYLLGYTQEGWYILQ